MSKKTLVELYHYFDQLVESESEVEGPLSLADVLFASSYIRGFIALEAANFGDEQQVLSAQLAEKVTEKIADSRLELTPQDQQIVTNYWHQLKMQFIG